MYGSSASEELGDRRGGDARVDVVGLVGQGAALAVGQRLGQGGGRAAEEPPAGAAVDDQGRLLGRRRQLGRQRQVAGDLGVVGEGVGDRLQPGAERRVPQLDDQLRGEADALELVELDGVAAVARPRRSGLSTVNRGARASASGAVVDRSLNAPTTMTTGGPSPSSS
jgi:hypothetical protein